MFWYILKDIYPRGFYLDWTVYYRFVVVMNTSGYKFKVIVLVIGSPQGVL